MARGSATLFLSSSCRLEGTEICAGRMGRHGADCTQLNRVVTSFVVIAVRIIVVFTVFTLAG